MAMMRSVMNKWTLAIVLSAVMLLETRVDLSINERV